MIILALCERAETVLLTKRSPFIAFFSISESLGTIFDGSELCQWLMQHDYVHGEEMARAYLHKLINQKQLICVNQTANDSDLDVSTRWFVFSTKDQ